jgi:hypothetical protein
MIMPTVTTIIPTFFQYYQAGADPYANPGKLLGNFAPVGTGANTPTPTDLKAIAESTTHPLAMLLMPFAAGLAGDPNQQKYSLAGDVTAEGQLPTMHLPLELLPTSQLPMRCWPCGLLMWAAHVGCSCGLLMQAQNLYHH